MSQFVEHGLPNLITNVSFVRADRLDIFLVEDDAVRSYAKIEHTFLGGRYTLEDSQNETACLAGTDLLPKCTWSLAQPWPVLNNYRKVVDPFSELRWKRVQHFPDKLDEVLPLHHALLLDSLHPLSGMNTYS
ncbi:MAG: hypothetical protein WA830_19125 [Candidatus Sulfotelmatobacter sp.]